MDRFTDRLLFVSGYEERVFRSKIGAPKATSRVIYNGLRDHEFTPVPPAHGAADFLYIGMMRDLKGPDLFIDALAAASTEVRRELTAVMVGDGDDLPAYKAQVERLGLSHRIAFHPPMPARRAFAMARAIVVPSRAEAMPYVVLEALAAGMPMIATSVGGIPEIFDRYPHALATPDVASLSSRMRELASDPARWKTLMPPAGDLRERFGADQMAARIEAEYFAVLGGDEAARAGRAAGVLTRSN